MRSFSLYPEKELIRINTNELTQEQEAQAQETSFFISNTDSRQKYAKTLQNALNAGMIFPEVEINFDSLEVYRLVDYSEKPILLSRCHFNSQVEDGMNVSDLEDCWKYYSCSCFKTYKKAANLAKTPRRSGHLTAVVKGRLCPEGGSLYQADSKNHRHWFLYAGYDPSINNFKEVNCI